jgi:hypothetical protein
LLATAISSSLKLSTLMPMCRDILKFAIVSAVTISLGITDDFDQAWHVLRPVIHAKDEDRVSAMRSAPVILVAQIQGMDLSSQPREVEKPSEVGGPMVPVISLHLARISAKPLLNVRGNRTGLVEFYGWVWASGKHGGPRLFKPAPDSVHILFLREEAGYLHTVGDYPAYDVEIPLPWVQDFIANWDAGDLEGADLMERIVAVRLKAELESVKETERDKYWLNTAEMATLTSPAFVTSQLNELCYRLVNPIGRAIACAESAQASKN